MAPTLRQPPVYTHTHTHTHTLTHSHTKQTDTHTHTHTHSHTKQTDTPPTVLAFSITRFDWVGITYELSITYSF